MHDVYALDFNGLLSSQKWERENNSLPANQRRPTPQRPDVTIDHSEWNTAAWEESQVFHLNVSSSMQIAPIAIDSRGQLSETDLLSSRNTALATNNRTFVFIDVDERILISME